VYSITAPAFRESMFVVVKFKEGSEVEAIPESWLCNNCDDGVDRCFWPPYRTTAKKAEMPSTTWKTYEVIVLYRCGEFVFYFVEFHKWT